LGGHSLNLIRLLAQVKQVLHVELGISQVIAEPTIRELARLIIAKQEGMPRLFPEM